MVSLKQYYFDKFKWSLMALASSSCVQKNLFPENSMVGEEIVLEYEEAVGENLERIHEYIDIEPTRVFRRQFILSHATLADSSNRR